MSVVDNALARLRAAPGADAEGEARPDLSVVDGGIGPAARLAGFVVPVLIVTFTIGLVGLLFLHATMVQTQSELDAERRAIAELEAETEALRHELAELEAPARIVAEAHALGMTEAPSVTYLPHPGGSLDERSVVAARNELLSG